MAARFSGIPAITLGVLTFAACAPAEAPPRELRAEAPVERPGLCSSTLLDTRSGTRLTIRGWDERTLTYTLNSRSTTERYQHGYYTPADPIALGLRAGQELAVDCRRHTQVGLNTPDFLPSRPGAPIRSE